MKKTINNTKKINNEDIWLKLDNAALIYPAAKSDSWTSVYRISAFLKKEVNPEILQQALDLTIKRFPHINVCIKRGLFWYFFQNLNKKPTIEKEEDYPCKKIEIGSGRVLFRVLYFKNKISMETFHSLTDGVGTKNILICLVGCYLELCGYNVDNRKMLYSYLDRPTDEEIEDSFLKYADLKQVGSRKGKKPYRTNGVIEPNNKLNIITAKMNLQELKTLTKKYGGTVTEFLVAVYMRSIYSTMSTEDKKRRVVVSVPVDLRKMFNTNTLRNFSSWINVSISDGNTLENDILDIKEQMKNVTKENMLKNINANVKAQKNFVVRILPLVVKNSALKFSYRAYGERQYTSVFSNLGVVDMPDCFKEYIDHFEFYLGVGKYNKVHLSAATYNDIVAVSITSVLRDRKIEKEFFRSLAELGLNLTIDSNIEWGKYEILW